MAPTVKINLADKVDDGEMDLSMCGLQEVPIKEIAAYPKVWSLDLSSNHLVQITKKLPTLTNLSKLDLSKNKIKKLPDNFGDLHRLRHLDLYKNELQHLPLSFGQLKNLKWLDLKDNPLVPAIQEAAGDCLDSVQCQVCATNMVYFFTKLREKVEEEQKVREKQRQVEKEQQQAELAAVKNLNIKAPIPEKKRRKENVSQTKDREELANQESPAAENKVKEQFIKPKGSFTTYIIVAALLLITVLFVLTACGFDKTLIIEEFAGKMWACAMSYCPAPIRDVGEMLAEYFLLLHRKVGYYVNKPENENYLTTLNIKIREIYRALIH